MLFFSVVLADFSCFPLNFVYQNLFKGNNLFQKDSFMTNADRVLQVLINKIQGKTAEIS
jgi:hypothetical protein